MVCVFLKRWRNLSWLWIVAFLANMFSPYLALSQELPVYSVVPQSVALQGMTIHPDDPLKFDFWVDAGTAQLNPHDFTEQTQTLIGYFIASLAVPETDMWVNLSPYEPERIIPADFGKTRMGRDLLNQDYFLKQLTASLMNPESPSGRKFWDRVYASVYEKYGAVSIPVDTFNKVWIVPESVSVYERPDINTVFVDDSRLNVMLESDYLAQKQHNAIPVEGKSSDSMDAQTRSMIRDVILPEIKREVNEGETFAVLRQVMNSLILARWYKSALVNSPINQAFVNEGRTAGVSVDPAEKQRIYEQYVRAFENGAYDVLKEEYDPQNGDVVTKKYFSGGILPAAREIDVKTRIPGNLMQAGRRGSLRRVGADLAMLGVSTKAGNDTNQAMLSKRIMKLIDLVRSNPVRKALIEYRKSVFQVFRFLKAHYITIPLTIFSMVSVQMLSLCQVYPWLSIILGFAPLILMYGVSLGKSRWSIAAWASYGLIWVQSMEKISNQAVFGTEFLEKMSGNALFWANAQAWMVLAALYTFIAKDNKKRTSNHFLREHYISFPLTLLFTLGVQMFSFWHLYPLLATVMGLAPLTFTYWLAFTKSRWSIAAWGTYSLIWVQSLEKISAHPVFWANAQTWMVFLGLLTFIAKDNKKKAANSLRRKKNAKDNAQLNGGIDLEVINIADSHAPSLGKFSINSDQRLLERLKNADGLKVMIRDVQPISLSNLANFLGIGSEGCFASVP